MNEISYRVRNLGNWDESGHMKSVSQYDLNMLANEIEKLEKAFKECTRDEYEQD